MKKTNHKIFNKENNKEKQLRQKVKELEREVCRLKSELKTYNKAFEKTSAFIKGNLQGVTVENAIQSAREEKPLKDIEPDIEYDIYEVKRDG